MVVSTTLPGSIHRGAYPRMSLCSIRSLSQSAVDETVLARWRAAIQSISAFSCEFARTRWFDEEVLWLDPAPADPFRQLTTAVWDAFADYPPFGGVYDEIVLHLTVAHQRSSDGIPLMQAVERAVHPLLPVEHKMRRNSGRTSAPTGGRCRRCGVGLTLHARADDWISRYQSRVRGPRSAFPSLARRSPAA